MTSLCKYLSRVLNLNKKQVRIRNPLQLRLRLLQWWPSDDPSGQRRDNGDPAKAQPGTFWKGVTVNKSDSNFVCQIFCVRSEVSGVSKDVPGQESRRVVNSTNTYYVLQLVLNYVVITPFPSNVSGPAWYCAPVGIKPKLPPPSHVV